MAHPTPIQEKGGDHLIGLELQTDCLRALMGIRAPAPYWNIVLIALSPSRILPALVLPVHHRSVCFAIVLEGSPSVIWPSNFPTEHFNASPVQAHSPCRCESSPRPFARSCWRRPGLCMDSPSFASNPFFGDEVRLRTCMRSLTAASV